MFVCSQVQVDRETEFVWLKCEYDRLWMLVLCCGAESLLYSLISETFNIRGEKRFLTCCGLMYNSRP
uniref:Uncharacterized protein n=1 Tax=Anguilla anguilla TaxID=7936 RepID=A0A0E9S888_ANGAN